MRHIIFLVVTLKKVKLVNIYGTYDIIKRCITFLDHSVYV